MRKRDRRKDKGDAACSRAEGAVLYQATGHPEALRTFEAHLVFSIVLATTGHSLKAVILASGYYIPLKLELKIFCRHSVTVWCQGNLGNVKRYSALRFHSCRKQKDFC